MTILGAGGMGTALAVLLARTTPLRATLGAGTATATAEIQIESRKQLATCRACLCPRRFEVTSDAIAALRGQPDLVIAAIPTAFLRSTLNTIAHAAPAGRARA